VISHGLYRLQHCGDAHTLASILSRADYRRWYVQLRKVGNEPEWFIITTDEETNVDPIVQSVTRWENGNKLPLDEGPKT